MQHRYSTPSRPTTASVVSLIAVIALATGCSATDTITDTITADTITDTAEPTATVTAGEMDGSGAVGALRSDEVHTIEVGFDEDDFEEMIATYTSTGEKDWIEATVVIDGVTYGQVGMRLKGNSSLRGVTADDDPATIPWLIRLDKYVDGQAVGGVTDLVVRSNTSASSLNEAVALELLELAGLASQDAVGAAFSVNGGPAVFRLVIEHPDDAWMAENFDTDGALYKAESTGDYSYRGDDPDAYDEVFDQEAGADHADLSPLIEFLEFVNDADDATFVAELGDRLDVDAFATYLAMQTLIDNFDDIDGPGNNSYLYYDTDTGQFTVVPWDHNLAFGADPGGGPGGPGGGPGGPGGGPGGPGGGVPDDGALPPAGERPSPSGDLPEPGDMAGPGGPVGSNILAERFLETWSDLVDARTAELRTELYDSGVADQILVSWSDLVVESGLVDAGTVAADAEAIAAIIAS